MSLLALFILIMLPFIQLLLSHATGPHEPNFGLEPILACFIVTILEVPGLLLLVELNCHGFDGA